MGRKKSTCLYLDARVVETARKLGHNISKVSENALAEAVEWLKGAKLETSLNGQARAYITLI